MPLRKLDPKPGNPIINSGDFLEFLNEQGVNVAGDTVIAHADGSVEVDTLATTSLDEAWEAFEPPAPPPPAATRREQIIAAIDAATTLDELKAAIIDVAGPALVIDES
jgi:hypothetical protein